MALCFSAMEAMVCSGRKEVVKMLSENIAVLLESDHENHKDAKRFIKKMYDHRCDVLHGRDLTHPIRIRTTARAIAAGILSAMVGERRDLKKRMESESTPNEWCNELQEAFARESIVPGVSPSPLSSLWRKGL